MGNVYACEYVSTQRAYIFSKYMSRTSTWCCVLCVVYNNTMCTLCKRSLIHPLNTPPLTPPPHNTQVVLRHSHNADELATAVNGKITEFANRGFRALGVSIAQGHQDVSAAKFEMVAVVPLFDPPRHDTKDTIDRCLAMGVHVKMVTGDQTLIGKETARQLGMSTDIYTIDYLHSV